MATRQTILFLPLLVITLLLGACSSANVVESSNGPTIAEAQAVV